MNFIRRRHAVLNQDLPYLSRCAALKRSAKKSIPTDGDTPTKKPIFRPKPPNNRITNTWTAIGWPTNIQSKTPDGKFGPAKMITGWGDCWFLSVLAAVANDQQGHQILSQSIAKVDGGYNVTFKGLPTHSIFISDSELDKCINERGGDADTRLMELAADKFFNQSGNFQATYLATMFQGGYDQDLAQYCLDQLKDIGLFQDPLTFNPMRGGCPSVVAFFMLTGLYPNTLIVEIGTTMHENDVTRFLNQYFTNDRDGASITINGLNNPLGNDPELFKLLPRWDAIRTEITSNGTLSPQQLAFLNALDRWLETRLASDMQVLLAAVAQLRLQHSYPAEFVDLLDNNQMKMSPEHFNLLRSGVQQVLAGKSGYIGFTGQHGGTLEGINQATNTFTYCEPNYPTLVHTGVLSDLIQAIISRNVFLNAVEPTTEQDAGESSGHAGISRGRRLRQIHNQVVRDGKIDPSESGPLADLMEMDDDTFRHIYDSDQSGVIEGGELKAVQKRVDRWVDRLALTPIW